MYCALIILLNIMCYSCILQLDVTGLNYVSRMSHSFVLMTVEHAAFSSDGQWLATVSVPWSAVETHIIYIYTQFVLRLLMDVCLCIHT